VATANSSNEEKGAHLVASQLEVFSTVGKPLPTSSATGAGIKDLMARMGHDSERAAMIYQHKARGADAAMTNAIDAHVQAEQSNDDDGHDGLAGVLVPAG
jgi:hypothetical protein